MNFCDNFVGLQRGGKEVQKEIIGGNFALTVGTACHDHGLERQYQAGHISRGIRVGHAAANRAAIAHLLIADQ